MAKQTDQQKREKALMVALARSAAELELEQDKDIADFLGISPQSFSKYKKRNFRLQEYSCFARWPGSYVSLTEKCAP